MTLSLNGARHVLASIDDWLALEGVDRPIVEVPVPEFMRPGDTEPPIVLLRAMDAAERDEWELRFIGDQHVEPDEQKRQERLRKRKIREFNEGEKARLLVHCIVNERGERLFDLAQVVMLQQRNAAAINRLAEKANELCGFTKADIEELVKNSSARRDDAPPSD